ncbi:hypothetical protein D1646_00040 [Pseudoflavonifractor sp. 60]|uniref:YczE/YyaS/YitT family protein n=1 Tax=Pseudoflavonifractor sp. 60 TaxID=2304576 RepID=UPI00136D4BD4|nr:DUF6198 family protein [Pseudoflavonifractor sp. 60]NBI65217.1 hypothetical protein [Pseudoflavonifractor sp. 60]
MKNPYRWLIYGLGMVVLALGIALNTKAGLGVSPIISVAYSVSRIYSLNFGDMTFLLYVLFVIVQLFLRSREERAATLLQIVVSLIFSRMLNLFDALIPYSSGQHSLAVNLMLLAVAIFLTGLGIAMTVNMRLVPNPGDGIVQAIAEKIGRDQGFTKNIFDIGCVCTTVAVGLICSGQVVGIGIGTIAAMIGVGRAIALVNHIGRDKMLSAAGMA